MKWRKWNKKDSIIDNETSLYHSRSTNVALSRPDAVWILYASEVRGDGGIRSFGIPLL